MFLFIINLVIYNKKTANLLFDLEVPVKPNLQTRKLTVITASDSPSFLQIVLEIYRISKS